MMWNHVLTTLRGRTKVDYDEMAGLIGYLWSLEPQGDARRGQAAFTKMGCGSCHADPAKGGPVLSERDLSPVSLISAVSTHGPAMRAAMKKKSLAWPRIGRAEIADIAAYLKARQSSAAKPSSAGTAGGGPVAAARSFAAQSVRQEPLAGGQASTACPTEQQSRNKCMQCR